VPVLPPLCVFHSRAGVLPDRPARHGLDRPSRQAIRKTDIGDRACTLSRPRDSGRDSAKPGALVQ
jgi:hypothetical protein